MKATATISSKGHLTLPKEVRERLGVDKGDEVEFTLDEQGVHIRPKRDGDNPFLAWLQAAPPSAAFEDVREARHAGLDDDERALLHQGPGVRVIRVGDLDREDSASPSPSEQD